MLRRKMRNSSNSFKYAIVAFSCLAMPANAATNSPADVENIKSSLLDLSETIKRMDKASSDLWREATRHDEVPMQGRQYMIYDNMYSMSNVGQSNMIPTVDGPVLPVRKKFVDLSTEQIHKLIALLTQDLNSIPLPAAGLSRESDAKRAQLEVAGDDLKEIETLIAKLDQQTKGPTYENAPIATTTKSLSQTLEGLEALRKRLSRMYDKK
jgi:hypothetical protein